MKVYEKPKLMALSLSGNDQLCGSCREAGATTLLYQHALYPEIAAIGNTLDWLIGDGDGKIERADVSNVFGTNEGCRKVCESYCKFLGASTVAWS